MAETIGVPYANIVQAAIIPAIPVLRLAFWAVHLEAGKRGDVVIWSGDPLELDSAPEAVWIDGVRQPLDNHQTRLRDRYRSLDREALPEGY